MWTLMVAEPPFSPAMVMPPDTVLSRPEEGRVRPRFEAMLLVTFSEPQFSPVPASSVAAPLWA